VLRLSAFRMSIRMRLDPGYFRAGSWCHASQHPIGRRLLRHRLPCHSSSYSVEHRHTPQRGFTIVLLKKQMVWHLIQLQL